MPYPAGGGSDFLARTLSQQLSTQIKQSILVDNKPGGNTAIAASELARSAPDGYTIMSADNGTLVFNTALYAKLSYNPDKDLAPVTLMGRFPMVLVVGPASDAKDAKDFIAKAKAKPGSVNFGSAGAGSHRPVAGSKGRSNSTGCSGPSRQPCSRLRTLSGPIANTAFARSGGPSRGLARTAALATGLKWPIMAFARSTIP